MKKTTLSIISVFLISALNLGFGVKTSEAAVSFELISHSTLIGHNPGLDKLWGTADDDNAGIQMTTNGNSSLSLFLSTTNPPFIGITTYFSGGFSIVRPITQPATMSYETLVYGFEGSSNISTLNTNRSPRSITFSSKHMFNSLYTITNKTTGSPDIDSTVETTGFALYNATGLDDPSVFGDPLLLIS